VEAGVAVRADLESNQRAVGGGKEDDDACGSPGERRLRSSVSASVEPCANLWGLVDTFLAAWRP
jgi:hypothetical protein